MVAQQVPLLGVNYPNVDARGSSEGTIENQIRFQVLQVVTKQILGILMFIAERWPVRCNSAPRFTC